MGVFERELLKESGERERRRARNETLRNRSNIIRTTRLSRRRRKRRRTAWTAAVLTRPMAVDDDGDTDDSEDRWLVSLVAGDDDRSCHRLCERGLIAALSRHEVHSDELIGASD